MSDQPNGITSIIWAHEISGSEMTSTAAPTVNKETVVNAPIDEAFRVFTDRFGDFKPPEHNLLRAPIIETVFDGRVGGHILDRADDGSECHWASPRLRAAIVGRVQLVHRPDLAGRAES